MRRLAAHTLLAAFLDDLIRGGSLSLTGVSPPGVTGSSPGLSDGVELTGRYLSLIHI